MSKALYICKLLTFSTLNFSQEAQYIFGNMFDAIPVINFLLANRQFLHTLSY